MLDQRLSIISEHDYTSKNGKILPGYLCKCSCGKIKIVSKYNYDSGKTRSCGCLIKDFNKKTKRGMNEKYEILFPEKTEEIKHIIISFNSMKQRCYRKKSYNYKNYGERGIIICEEWLNDRDTFIKWALNNGYRLGLSIDRIDVNGNYEPSNCRWASREEQANNTTKNTFISYNGEIFTITQLSRKIDIDIRILRSLAKKGYGLCDYEK